MPLDATRSCICKTGSDLGHSKACRGHPRLSATWEWFLEVGLNAKVASSSICLAPIWSQRHGRADKPNSQLTWPQVVTIRWVMTHSLRNIDLAQMHISQLCSRFRIWTEKEIPYRSATQHQGCICVYSLYLASQLLLKNGLVSQSYSSRCYFPPLHFLPCTSDQISQNNKWKPAVLKSRNAAQETSCFLFTIIGKESPFPSPMCFLNLEVHRSWMSVLISCTWNSNKVPLPSLLVEI